MDNELELAKTLKQMKSLLAKARSVAEPILRRWDEEEAAKEKAAA